MLNVQIITPGARGSHTGNRVTALRWAKRLRELEHSVAVHESYDGSQPDLLIALHARKSATSIEQCRSGSRRTRIVVALTGTDVYGELTASPEARHSLAAAERIVVLQPRALDALEPELRGKARVIYQSAAPA